VKKLTFGGDFAGKLLDLVLQDSVSSLTTFYNALTITIINTMYLQGAQLLPASNQIIIHCINYIML